MKIKNGIFLCHVILLLIHGLLVILKETAILNSVALTSAASWSEYKLPPVRYKSNSIKTLFIDNNRKTNFNSNEFEILKAWHLTSYNKDITFCMDKMYWFVCN